MFQTLRTKFGIPGVISVIALVFAMAGGAFAANNLASSGGGGKATASAKGKQGPRGKTGKTGPAGPTGPAGAPGAKGDTGAAGSNGTPGAAGAAGTSVTSTAVPTGVATCNGRGGSEFKTGAVTTTACNGKEGVAGADGSPWTAGGTLPSGSTEKGTFTIGPLGTLPFGRVALSFTVPLATSVDVFVQPLPVGASQEEIEAAEKACPGSRENPVATKGFLCVYELNNGGLELTEVQNPETSGLGKAGKVGVLLKYEPLTSGGNSRGDWAVTAP